MIENMTRAELKKFAEVLMWRLERGEYEDTEERECIEEMIDEAEDLYKSCPDETREDWEAHIMRDYYRTR